MRIRPSMWLVVLCCLAIFLMVGGRRAGQHSPHQDETRASDQGVDRGAAEPTESESPTPGTSGPGHGGGSQELVSPRPSPLHPVPERPAILETAAADGTKPPQARSATPPRPPVSDLTPEPGAEVLSYDPLLGRHATTNLARAMEKLRNARSESDRYLVLNDAAKLAFVFGKTEDARAYAVELLSLDQKFQAEPWRGGTAVHDGNLVLGRIALQENRIEEAKQYLLEAGNSTGSPVLRSFGPNMSLARGLLQNGEAEAVLQYFDRCSKFWGTGGGKLTQWTEDVRAGRMPDFQANLVY